ncbi:nitrous oxide reductase accessory protein NosL [Fuscibacter oryzae]|uniref:Nitrous oxide reductase accessory protein NosL n=1 Tax=Fuscibacter oryzae TaxID=2803939 RepID=A0A8J7MWH7_9RHOB|nr:nitrous oxide reductase accessory protein NosL [Fuscibacter oryzae]MBL4928984.1 nitrous oxide reductase accessory protein NosL [Fuscibacter oryzae]
MKRLFLALLLLAACRQEAAIPDPVALTPESVGYFCQMNILDHGGPKAQVHLDTFPGRPLFFSQISDAAAYLRMPERDGQIVATYVTDMGAADWNAPDRAPWVEASKATYVVGSDRLGGMDQPELIPFADPAKASTFAAQHGGMVQTLDQILATAPTKTQDAAAPDDDADFAARLSRAKESN